MSHARSTRLAAPGGLAPTSEASGRFPAGPLRSRVAALLFPPAPERSGPRWRSILFSVVFVAAATVASLLRQSGVSAVNSIWAEDGQVFYQAVFHQSYLGALFTQDNGYLDLVPRVLIGVLGHVPVAYAAETFALVGAVGSSLVALAVYYATAGHVPSRALRLCMAIPTAVLIAGQLEVGNSIVNLQWYLIYAFFWMLLWSPRTVGAKVVAALLLCAAIGSDPITVAFVPLLVVRLWALPWRESLWQVGGVLLGVAYQAVGFLQGDAAKRPQVPDYNLTYAETRYRGQVLAEAISSPHELSFIGLHSIRTAEVAGLVALIVIGALGAWLARPQWLMAGICIVFSVCFYFAVTSQGGLADQRYSVVPGLLLIAAAVFLVTPPAPRAAADAVEPDAADAGAEPGGSGHGGHGSRSNRATLGSRVFLVPTAVLCVVLGLNFVASYYGGIPTRGTSASWSSQVHAGTEACAHKGVTEAVLATAPGGHWVVDVPCSALGR